MFTNSMTNLINKISHILELDYLEQFFPKELKKETWTKCITEISLLEFSKYVPNKIRYMVNASRISKDGWYFIDENDIPGDIKILGVKDLDFDTIASDPFSGGYHYGYPDNGYTTFGVTDIMDMQMMADHSSFFNRGIYVEFEPPNRIRLRTSTANFIKWQTPQFPVTLYLSHADNLLTISPTKMDLFERLAACDVAKYLYASLKYFDHLETSYGNVELKLETLEQWKDMRQDIINELKEGFVSAGGSYPLCISV